METTLTARVVEMNAQNAVMLACDWANARERADFASSQRHLRKRVDDELIQANKETILKRRARLKQFLAAEAEG